MRYVGIDLHKRSLTVCVIDKESEKSFARRLYCDEADKVRKFFEDLGPFQAVIEATATYEWLWELLEPLADRVVLGHPKKIKVISESMKKTDKNDAYFLAWLLSHNAVPEAQRPTPRQREYQHLVRLQVFFKRKRAQAMVKIRQILAARNLESKGLFTRVPPLSLANQLPPAEKFSLESLVEHLDRLQLDVKKVSEELKRFRAEAPAAEKESHEILTSIPGIGPITADVTLSTLGNVTRFSSIKKVTAYAGVVPGVRASDKTRKELGITKEGSRLLRWSLIQSAWQSIRWSPSWLKIFQRIAQRRGRKKAIVAVARRLLGVIYTLLKKRERYVERAPARTNSRSSPPQPRMAFGVEQA